VYVAIAAFFSIRYEKSLVVRGLESRIPAQSLSSVKGRETSGYAVVALSFLKISEDPILGYPVIETISRYEDCMMVLVHLLSFDLYLTRA
jgi:hypothetical protein